MPWTRYRYPHIGIPTLQPGNDEHSLEEYRVYHSGYENSAFGIEWMRYEEGCTLPGIVRLVPHETFEADDIVEAIKGKKVIIAPNSPSDGCIVAFIEKNGAPIEFLQFS